MDLSFADQDVPQKMLLRMRFGRPPMQSQKYAMMNVSAVPLCPQKGDEINIQVPRVLAA